VVFKDALEDIITIRKLWSKVKLKELSKYDLNNPVLEWLMIRDIRGDKEIKEILSLSSYDIIKIKSDNIILYYLSERTNEDKFVWTCQMGHIKVAQWLYSLGDVDIHNNKDFAFCSACWNNHLEVAQWLYFLGGIDIHFDYELPFRLTNQRGHLKLAQWIYSLGGINIHIVNQFAFRWACKNNHLETAQWLWSLGGFYKDNIKTEHQPIIDWLATLDSGL